ncbi:MAG TPA: DUF484 family protein [Burkholderiales bacterium]|nr:DUF484 family protein [Burkholderiales bacterium]
MTPDAVATYLQEHPEFFEQYADLLADIYIPHPHGGRAIPIGERQILTLRERGKQLETKLREVIQYGEENDAIGEKVHRLALALISARDLPTLTTTLDFNLREDFAIPHVALELWRGEAARASETLRAYAAGLSTPYCGAHVPPEIVNDLFGEAAPQLQSFSVIALDAGGPFGVLALASEDARRFYPEMGTVYLKRIGELAAAALLRYV